MSLLDGALEHPASRIEVIMVEIIFHAFFALLIDFLSKSNYSVVKDKGQSSIGRYMTELDAADRHESATAQSKGVRPNDKIAAVRATHFLTKGLEHEQPI